jgi:uncharacterized protein YkwD
MGGAEIMKNRFMFRAAVLLAAAILGGAPVYGAGESETAAVYLAGRGVYEGDENGDQMLDKSLTRAELAVILTRLDFADAPGGLDEWRNWGAAHFSDTENRYNKFADIPNWALPYIEYCYQRGLMNGVGENRFDPQGEVNPKMACTVILRYCGIPEADYNTSVEKAQNIGIAPNDGVSGETVLRGTMAVIIRRGMDYDGTPPAETPVLPQNTPTPSEPPAQTEAQAMTIDEMKAEIVRLTNEERVKRGLPALEVLPALMDCAQTKADDMLVNRYWGHNSPVYGTHNEMIRAFVPGVMAQGASYGGWENLTVGSVATAPGAFNEWIYSEEHRANILEKHISHIGVGIAVGTDGRYYWVQQFIAL